MRWLTLSSALAIALSAAWLAPAHAQTAEELYRQGVQARQAERFVEAAKLLDRALALDPDNTDALVQRGFVHLALDERAAARSVFDKALEAAPDYADARYGLAQIAFRDGRLEDARGIVAPLAAASPDRKDFADLLASIDTAASAARAQARTARAEAAPAPSRLAARPRVDRTASLFAQGTALRRQGRFAEAEAAYRHALALGPDNADLLVALGLVSGFQQKFQDARGFFEAALAAAPGSVDARLGLVRLAVWEGDVGEARRRIEQVLQDEPGNSEAAVLEARISLLEGRYAVAEAGFARVIEREPENVEAIVGLGDVRRARGDEEGARIRYRRGLELSPGDADIAQRLEAPAPRRWRLDIGTDVSTLSDGRGTWTDSALALAYRWTPATTLSARSRVATRFGSTDLQFEGRVDHAFMPTFSAHGLFAATPDADFLARYSLGGGFSARAAGSAGAFGPVFLNLDARYDVFDAADVWTVAPSLQVYVLDERLAFTARWIHAEDDLGTVADGYLLRADLMATERLRLFAGYSDAPEISAGTLDDTQTAFAGVAVELSPALMLNASYAHEERTAFERDTFGFGLSLRF